RYGVRTVCVKQSIGYVGSSLSECSTVVRSTSAIDLPLVTPYPTKRLGKVCVSTYNHFYAMLGLVPCLVLVFLVNVFVGPAELTDIPEGYEPRHWEYHKHPISRFIAKYMSPHPQKTYESFLGQLDDIREQKELIFEDRWLRSSDRTYGDYRGWYFIPANPAGVIRARKELELDQEIGEHVSR
ncbi:NADH dehydrogenase (ubiquinone) 1 beta subcomplex 5, partial [Clonorchis sinensis]